MIRVPSKEALEGLKKNAHKWLDHHRPEMTEQFLLSLHNSNQDPKYAANWIQQNPSVLAALMGFAFYGYANALASFDAESPGKINRPKILGVDGKPMD